MKTATLLTVKEVAELLQVGVRAVQLLIKAGRIDVVVISPRCRRITAEALAMYIQQHTRLAARPVSIAQALECGLPPITPVDGQTAGS